MSFLRRPFPYRQYNAVLVLIGINILVYLGELFLRRLDLTFYLSMIPIAAARGWIWQFATYMFVHDPRSLSHILFNMLALFIFGSRVEARIGSLEFLLYYFLTGILAGVFSFLVYWFSGSPTVFLMGASGAIFAVQLAYAVLFPEAVLFLWGILPLKAPVMVLGFTVVEIVLMVTGLAGNVAHFTHLAGFAFGWLYFLIRFGINPWRAMRR
ncbi:MAG: rhomboid family intramembrane serine protease [Treponema sp.]|jgi:membrane associated rhomboid family serine protease|nr:rhomboid family intramembrane serine protease [Treponema sp.]